MGDFAHNYGPHFPLKVYYSRRSVDWLCSGRKGDIPDGAMMVKAMAFFSGVQTNVVPDGCMDVGPRQGSPISPILWAPMLKSSQSSHDGWLWMLQQVDLSFWVSSLNFRRPSSTHPHSPWRLHRPSRTIHYVSDGQPSGRSNYQDNRMSSCSIRSRASPLHELPQHGQVRIYFCFDG